MRTKTFFRLFAFLTILTLLLGGVPYDQTAQAQAAVWYARGDFNAWDTSSPMYDDGLSPDAAAGDGIYTTQVTIPTAGRSEFKIASSDWSQAYPGSGNSWLVTAADGEVVTITLNTSALSDGWLPESNAIGVSADPAAWTAVGSWQGWNNASPETAMSSQASGIYTYTTQIPTPGTYEYKAVHTGAWDAIGADSRSVNAATTTFTTTEAGQAVTLSVDALAGRIRVELGPTNPKPSHDNNIWWDGLAHDSRSDLYRVPFGAVTTGTDVIIRFRTYHEDVTGVTLRLWNTAASAQALLPMELVASSAEPPYGYDYWQAALPAQDQPTILYYRFIVRDGTKEVYYEDDDLFDGSWGKTYENSPDYSWQVDVYQPDFTTPDWMKNAIIYQIFPDRFFNGKRSNDPRPTDPTVYDSDVLKQDWSTLPEGYCRGYQGADAACEEQPMGRDFYGGDLKGIRDKLLYLKSLGVTAIYLNPIFKAPSNHLYDTSDYYTIDPYFGTQGDWNSLVDNARRLGIRVILDGVFNHTSSDSLYFDRYQRYRTNGACETTTSLFRSWYTFQPADPAGSGPCAGDTTYNSWWGFDSLPALTEIPEVRSFIYDSNKSVARYWILNGSAGWRLDVAPDKSHDWWQEFRPQVKSANKNAVIIGEIWDDASPWLLGNEFDSTMNYRFRRALLGFLNGASNDPNQGEIRGLNPDQFDSVMQSIKEDYPAPAYAAMMNLVGSHDTQRILWTLTPGERNREDREFNAENVAEGKSKLKLLALLQMTMPGAPTIYYGDEAGLTGDSDPDDRRAFQWNNIDRNLLGHYQWLAALRSRYSFLRTGSYDRLYTHNDDGTYAYGRKDASGAAVVAINNSPDPRTLVVNVAGYIPEGMVMIDALNGGKATVTGGSLTITVKGRWGAVLVTPRGADLVPPAAPGALSAVEGNGAVELSWDSVPGAAGYHLYRSLVTGGGYARVNDALLTGTSYTDTGVANGQVVYYVVTAVDAAGNESPRSPEASALPHLIIGWANLQWPPTITHTISAVDPTDTIYGQVWIDGATSQPGPTPGLIAQVGYGPQGSDPAASPDWIWVSAAFNVDSGNNDEFQGSLLPENTGSFDYAFRYSTTAGREWLYADLDGIGNGYSADQAGKLVVNVSSDTTPPAAPASLHMIESAASFLHIGWEAVADADLYG